jgi:hypothetical protein
MGIVKWGRRIWHTYQREHHRGKQQSILHTLALKIPLDSVVLTENSFQHGNDAVQISKLRLDLIFLA